MIRRTTKIALEVIAGLVAVAVLLLLVAAWRLSSGPVDLGFLTPRIEAALADPVTGVTVRIGATELAWGGWTRQVDLHTRDVAIRDSDGTLIAVLPDIVVGFSLRALVQGTLAPSTVDVFDAQLLLIRGEDGKLQFGARDTADDATPESDLSRLMPSVIEQLVSKQEAERPLSFLTELRILDARLFIEDRKAQISWEAPGAVIELRRSARGIAGEIGLAIEIRDTRATVASDFSYDVTNGLIEFSGSAGNLHPAALAWFAPELDTLTGLTTPLDVSLTATALPDGTIDSLDFDVEGAEGQFTLAAQFAEPLPIAHLQLRGGYSSVERRLTVDAGSLDIGSAEERGPRLRFSGSAAGLADDAVRLTDVEATVTASDVPMGDLGRYWPLGIGRNERDWVVGNITQGVAEQVDLRVSVRLSGAEKDSVEVRSLDGTFLYSDLEVHYMRPLPPVVGVSGTGVFDRSTMTFHPEGGHLGPLEVQSADIRIAGLDQEDQDMTIDLSLAGPLRTALEVLDHEHLALIRRLGIETAKVDGTANAQVGFRFPLLAALTIDEVEIEAQATLEQASIESFILGQDAREGQLSLTVNKAGMEVTGPLALGGVGVDLAWKEAFTDAAPYRTDLAAQIPKLDDAGRATFGIDLSPYVTGPVSTSIRMLTDHAGASTLSAAVNLQSATMAVAPLYWQKPPGDAGEAHMTLRMAAGQLAELSQFKIDAGTLRASGRGRFTEGTRDLHSLTLDEMEIDETKLRKINVTRQGDGYAIAIGGGTIDATPVFSDVDEAERKAAAAEAKSVPAAARTFTPLQLSAAKLDRLVFGPDRYLESVSLDFDRGVHGWTRLALNAEVPEALWSKARAKSDEAEAEQPVAPARTLRIDFAPVAAGRHELSVQSNDMGGVLRALDIADTIHGGNLEVVGQSDGPLPARPLMARIEARDYVIVDATILTKLLTVASLTGIVDLLQGEGITFTHLTGDVVLDDGVLTTDLVRAYGPALGLTIKGQLDFDEAVADLQGTIVPAYTVNRVLGGIPLLGQLLVGGEGEGFLAFIYKITGPLADPVVDVNTLSALAPGFLRGLFGLLDSDEKPSEEDQPRAFPDRD